MEDCQSDSRFPVAPLQTVGQVSNLKHMGSESNPEDARDSLVQTSARM